MAHYIKAAFISEPTQHMAELRSLVCRSAVSWQP